MLPLPHLTQRVNIYKTDKTALDAVDEWQDA